jgi:hypothetical protein
MSKECLVGCTWEIYCWVSPGLVGLRYYTSFMHAKPLCVPHLATPWSSLFSVSQGGCRWWTHGELLGRPADSLGRPADSLGRPADSSSGVSSEFSYTACAGLNWDWVQGRLTHTYIHTHAHTYTGLHICSSALLICPAHLLCSSALLICSAHLLCSSALLVCSAHLLVCSAHLLVRSSPIHSPGARRARLRRRRMTQAMAH